MENGEHKFFAAALGVSLVACLAFCVAVAPQQRAYADEVQPQASGYTEVQLLEYIWDNLKSLNIGLGTNGANADSTPLAYEWLYSKISSIESALTDNTATGQYNMLYTINANMVNGLQNITTRLGNIAGDVGDLWALSVTSDYISGTSTHSAYYYWRQTYGKADMISQQLTAWSNEIGTGWYSNVTSKLQSMNSNIRSATSYLSVLVDDLEEISDKLDKYWVTNDYVTIGNSQYTTPHYLMGSSLIATVSQYATYLSNIQSSLKDTNLAGTNNTKTLFYYVKNIYSNISDIDEMIYNLLYGEEEDTYPYNMLNGLNAINTMLNNSLMYRNQTVASWLYGIYDSLQTVIDLMLVPSANDTADLIGDFDEDAFKDNYEDLKSDLRQLAVYGSFYAIGNYYTAISTVDPIESPSFEIPFEFAGSNETVILDLSWLDDEKQLINFVTLFMLFMALTGFSMRAVVRS